MGFKKFNYRLLRKLMATLHVKINGIKAKLNLRKVLVVIYLIITKNK